MSRLGNIGGRLYRGEVSFDFVGRRSSGTGSPGAILADQRHRADLFRG